MSTKAVTPSVEEIIDVASNIAEPTAEQLVESQAEQLVESQAEPSQPQQEFFSISDVVNIIKQKFSREFPKLLFRLTAQLTDGSIVEFVDTEMETPVVIVTARLRIRNNMMIDPKSGIMWMKTELSDVSFGGSSLRLVSQSDTNSTTPA